MAASPLTVQCWTSVASPWAWLGSARFRQMAEARPLQVQVLPVHLERIFQATGGLPFTQRSPARQSYRQLELQRWSRHLQVPITLQPRYYPVDREPASRLLIALRASGLDPSGRQALALLHDILRAIWVEDRNIADRHTLAALAEGQGLDAQALLDAAEQPQTGQQFTADTLAAVAAGVFGAPTWIVDGERFWGQDRLTFLEAALDARGVGDADTRPAT
jgi:2-hydroxychromene-2-carboxylate isomerase